MRSNVGPWVRVAGRHGWCPIFIPSALTVPALHMLAASYQHPWLCLMLSLAARPIPGAGAMCRAVGAWEQLSARMGGAGSQYPGFHPICMGQLWGTLYGIPRGQQGWSLAAHCGYLLVNTSSPGFLPFPTPYWCFLALPPKLSSRPWDLVSESALGEPNPRHKF